MLSDYLDPEFPHPQSVRYTLGVLIFLLALALRFVILPIEDRLAFATFYPATAFAFWLCGIGPGLLALALSAATGFYIFTPPVWSWAMTWPGFISVASYVLSSLLMAWVVVLQRRANRQLHVTRARLRAIVSEQAAILNSDLIGIAKARDRKTVWANPALARMFHYSLEELVDMPTRRLYLDDASHRAFGEAAYPVLRTGATYRAQVQMARKGGEALWVDISGTLLSEETGESLWMMHDISDMKHHQAQIEKLASYDTLTGLPNRLLLADRLQQGRLLNQRLGTQLAVCFIDLDGFKVVNDEYGHDAGDHLLRVIAARLQTCVRGNDTVARLGGDEFVLLLSNLQQREECVAILERALMSVCEPVPLPGSALARVSASIGVALYPVHADDDASLMTQADAAMYKAKRAGRNQMHFSA